VRKRFTELGRQLISSTLAGAEVDYSEEKVKAAAPKVGFKTADELLAAVGRNDIALADVLAAIAPPVTAAQSDEIYKPTRRFGSGVNGSINVGRPAAAFSIDGTL